MQYKHDRSGGGGFAVTRATRMQEYKKNKSINSKIFNISKQVLLLFLLLLLVSATVARVEMG